MAQKNIVKAEFVSVRRAQFVYGRDAAAHFILRVGVKNPETGATHYADLPLIYTPGADWAFYDKASGTSKARKTVAKDTADAIARARRIFPQWAEYVDALPEDAAPSEAFRWFDDNAGKGVMVDAAFTERDYTTAEGEAKTSLDAQLFEQFEEALPDDFDARFAKVLKASEFKLGVGAKKPRGGSAAAGGGAGARGLAPTAPDWGGGAAKATAPDRGGGTGTPQGTGAAEAADFVPQDGGGGAGAEKPPEPADKPPAPVAGEAATTRRTIFAHPGEEGRKDTWRAYGEGGLLKYDPKGERFWGEVARITGRNLKDWTKFTANDWQKCVDVFMMQG